MQKDPVFPAFSGHTGLFYEKNFSLNKKALFYRAFWTLLDVAGRVYGGSGRNRTGVHGVAVRCMTTLPPSQMGKLKPEADRLAHHFEFKNLQCAENAVKLERETGFEPATSTLARLRSTN